MIYVGTFFDLLSPYTVLCGIAFILVFTYHGGLFTSIKTAGAVSERARAASLVVGVPTAISALALVGCSLCIYRFVQLCISNCLLCVGNRVLPHFLGGCTYS